MTQNKLKYAESAILSLVWVVLLVTPILFREDYTNPVWNSIHNQLEILIPLSVLYLINRLLLVPYFLFRGKAIIYVATVFMWIAVLAYASYYYDSRINVPPASREQNGPVQDLPPPPPGEKQVPGREVDPQPGQRQPRPVPPFVNFLIFSVLVIGFDTGLKSGLRWLAVENEKMVLEKENAASQLILLRNQISPHFFMNTLNNIHALVDRNSELAKEAIIKLSKMMRYLLYETETEKTPLSREVEFLESYINLMRLRYSSKISINVRLPEIIPDVKIPPFLFISLIENAFKHGISYSRHSMIDFEMMTDEKKLLLIIKNTKNENKQEPSHSGIGIENTRKRLNLIYGSKYHMEIIDSLGLFTVTLTIPL